MANPDEYKVGVFTPKDIADMAGYEEEDRELILRIAQEERETFRHFTEDYRYTIVDGIVHEEVKEGVVGCGKSDGPIHSYFGLTYASWLAIPRLTLQEMPREWQAQFVALLREADDLGIMHRPECKVTVIGSNGKFLDGSHWHNYRRGSVENALAEDKRYAAHFEAVKEAKRTQHLRKIEERVAESNE